MSRRITTILFAALIVLAVSLRLDAGQPDGESLSAAGSSGVKRALIVCGHPGDVAHAKTYAGVLRNIHTALTTKLAFSADNVHVQFGGKWPDDPKLTHGPATKESLDGEVAELRKSLQPDDSLWIIVIGHAHYDGRRAWLNLTGPDLSNAELAKLLSGLSCREQVLFITTPVSGFFLKPLAAPGRICISATEPDFETNETLYPQSLAEELLKVGSGLADEDKDGAISLLDLYIATARNVAQRYLDEMLLATEHSQLDDNSDGRGTEIQVDFLTVEQGGRGSDKPVPPRPETADSRRAAGLVLVAKP